VRPSPITPTLFDRQEHGEGLAGLVVPVGGTQFVDEDGVGTAQQVGVILA
jgi:hypothetical protein